jgi:hypothetical protein
MQTTNSDMCWIQAKNALEATTTRNALSIPSCTLAGSCTFAVRLLVETTYAVFATVKPVGDKVAVRAFPVPVIAPVFHGIK